MTISKSNNTDDRSREFVLIPFCLICQAFQAQGIVKYGYQASIKPVVEEILRRDINMIQMPCPESQFGGYVTGLKRAPKGIGQYDVSEFRELCAQLASETTVMIKAILSTGYDIAAIMGIEYSPSCATRIQYSARGTIRRPGLFMEALQNQLTQENLEIPFVGINRRGIKKSLDELITLLGGRKLFDS